MVVHSYCGVVHRYHRHHCHHRRCRQSDTHRQRFDGALHHHRCLCRSKTVVADIDVVVGASAARDAHSSSASVVNSYFHHRHRERCSHRLLCSSRRLHPLALTTMRGASGGEEEELPKRLRQSSPPATTLMVSLAVCPSHSRFQPKSKLRSVVGVVVVGMKTKKRRQRCAEAVRSKALRETTFC